MKYLVTITDYGSKKIYIGITSANDWKHALLYFLKEESVKYLLKMAISLPNDYEDAIEKAKDYNISFVVEKFDVSKLLLGVFKLFVSF